MGTGWYPVNLPLHTTHTFFLNDGEVYVKRTIHYRESVFAQWIR